jgi:hypothetical protein
MRKENRYLLSALGKMNTSRFVQGMTFLGTGLGIVLIIAGLLIDLVSTGKPIGFSNIVQAYSLNSVHWLILTSPFFLAMLFYVMGQMIAAREKTIDVQLLNQKQQFGVLEHFIVDLEHERYDVSVSADFENTELRDQLIQFRDKLKKSKAEDEKRLWENQGLAVFSDILRKSSELGALSNEVIRFLVNYLKCNQGSVFIQREDDQDALELVACYAFDRRKFVSKTVDIGEGLIGQCFQEKSSNVLYDVPDDYIKITSGLGTANPNCILIVPLLYNDVVTGVVEVASFRKLGNFEISFMEKCATAFGSVIQSIRINQNIKKLLSDSQQQTQQLRAQEEEMRQNLEELEAIQEQVSRQNQR